ncbi:MAG: lytic transglycosylase domain-containing protein [Treponema sp.]|nr:lytic transglycosylase domain-containing protein [Treponema sp.]
MRIWFLAPAGMILAAALGLGLYSRVGRYAGDLPQNVNVEAPAARQWTARENAAYTAEILESMRKPDRILAYYRNAANRPEILAFFTALVQSGEIAESVLNNADKFDIPPALAFALCWGESRFNTLAVNRANRNHSIDRGLFQLNDESFPRLTETDFFDPEINAYYGMAHLRWCLDFGGSELAGLAMYNAGVNRVKAGTTPRHTLDHVARIMEFKRGIEILFQIEYEQGLPPPQQEALIAKSSW